MVFVLGFEGGEGFGLLVELKMFVVVVVVVVVVVAVVGVGGRFGFRCVFQRQSDLLDLVSFFWRVDGVINGHKTKKKGERGGGLVNFFGKSAIKF